MEGKGRDGRKEGPAARRADAEERGYFGGRQRACPGNRRTFGARFV